MIILDTNVISERLRKEPNPNVVLWLDTQAADELYLCSPVLAELQYGVSRLDASTRKTALQNAVSSLVIDVFGGRFLSFEKDAAIECGSICAGRDLRGRPIAPMDAMIAAIAKSNNAILATRNVADFEQSGIEVVNPFLA
jgi:predicted nucleic acid-binding protein